MRVGESDGSRASQILRRLDAGELRGLDKRVEDGGDFGPTSRARAVEDLGAKLDALLAERPE